MTKGMLSNQNRKIVITLLLMMVLIGLSGVVSWKISRMEREACWEELHQSVTQIGNQLEVKIQGDRELLESIATIIAGLDSVESSEVQNIISEINANLQQQGLTLELYQQMTGQTMDQLKADVRENAEKRVKYQLIIAEIVKAENIEVSEEELAEEIKNIATYYGRDEEEVKKIFAGQEDRIKEDVASRKAVDLVKENVAK